MGARVGAGAAIGVAVIGAAVGATVGVGDPRPGAEDGVAVTFADAVEEGIGAAGALTTAAVGAGEEVASGDAVGVVLAEAVGEAEGDATVGAGVADTAIMRCSLIGFS